MHSMHTQTRKSGLCQLLLVLGPSLVSSLHLPTPCLGLSLPPLEGSLHKGA